MTSLKDRIAALQQKTNASPISQLAASKVAPATSNGRIMDKIANFEKKGGTPVPRGSFGLGAPSSQSRSSTRELYGNRFASAPISLSDSSVSRGTSLRTPPSTPSPRERRVSTFIPPSSPRSANSHHPRSNSSDGMPGATLSSAEASPNFRSPDLSPPQTAEESPPAVVIHCMDPDESDAALTSDVQEVSPVDGAIGQTDATIHQVSPTIASAQASAVNECGASHNEPPSSDIGSALNDTNVLDTTHIRDVADDSNCSFAGEPLVVSQLTIPEEVESQQDCIAQILPIATDGDNASAATSHSPREVPPEVDITITAELCSSHVADHTAELVIEVPTPEVQLQSENKRDSVPQIVVNAPDTETTRSTPVASQLDLDIEVADAPSDIVPAPIVDEHSVLASNQLDEENFSDERASYVEANESPMSGPLSAVESMIESSTSSNFSFGIEHIVPLPTPSTYDDHQTSTSSCLVAPSPLSAAQFGTSELADEVSPSSLNKIVAPSPSPALQNLAILPSHASLSRSKSLPSTRDLPARYAIEKELPVLPEEGDSPLLDIDQEGNSAGIAGFNSKHWSPTAESEGSGSGSPSSLGRSSSLRKSGKVYSKRYLPGHFRGNSNTSDDHSTHSIMTSSSTPSPTPSPPPTTPPSDMDLSMAQPRYFSDRLPPAAKPTPITIHRLSAITSSSTPSPRTPDIMAQFPAVPATVPQCSPEKGITRSKSTNSPSRYPAPPSTVERSKRTPAPTLPQWYDDDSGDEGGGGWASVVVTTRRYY